MHILYLNGFTTADRQHWAQVLFSNIMKCVHDILTFMSDKDMPIAGRSLLTPAMVELLLDNHLIEKGRDFPPNLLTPLKTFWNDIGVQLAVCRANEFALHDNIKL